MPQELRSEVLGLFVQRRDCLRLQVRELNLINDVDIFAKLIVSGWSRLLCLCIARRLPKNICSHD